MKNYKLWTLLKSFNILLILFLVQPGSALAQNVPNPTGWACAECGASAPVGTAVQHKSSCSSYRGGSGGGGTQVTNRPSVGDQRIAKASTFITKGDASYKSGNYKKAIAFYRKAYWYDPNDESLLRMIKDAKEKKANSHVSKPKPVKPKPVINNTSNDKAIKEKVITTINADKKNYKSQLQKLEAIKSIVPPLGFNKKKTVESGFMLGLFNEESVYLLDTNKLKNPSTGNAYKKDEYFAGTDKVSAFELYRGLRDSWKIGEYSLSTEYGQNLVRRIDGTHFESLIAHSNGATITEALIRTGHIKVDELNIIGGDRSLMNNDGYDELIKKHGVKKIVVWINPADLVPDGSSALKLIKSGIGYDKEYEKAFYDYVNNSLIGGKKTNPNVEYRILSGPEYSCGQSYLSPLDAHGFDCYMKNMKTYWKLHGK